MEKINVSRKITIIKNKQNIILTLGVGSRAAVQQVGHLLCTSLVQVLSLAPYIVCPCSSGMIPERCQSGPKSKTKPKTIFLCFLFNKCELGQQILFYLFSFICIVYSPNSTWFGSVPVVFREPWGLRTWT